MEPEIQLQQVLGGIDARDNILSSKELESIPFHWFPSSLFLSPIASDSLRITSQNKLCAYKPVSQTQLLGRPNLRQAVLTQKLYF